MLIVSAKRKTAFFAPIIWYFVSFAILVWLAADVQQLGVRALVPAFLGVAVLCAAVSDTRLIRSLGDVIVVRTVLRRDRLQADTCAIFIDVVPSARSAPSFEVHARDSSLHAKLSGAWSSRGAERARSRLAACLLAPPSNRPSAHSEADADVRAQQAQYEAWRVQARVQLDAYYRSAGARRIVYWIAVALALYLLGSAFYFSLGR